MAKLNIVQYTWLAFVEGIVVMMAIVSSVCFKCICKSKRGSVTSNEKTLLRLLRKIFTVMFLT